MNKLALLVEVDYMMLRNLKIELINVDTPWGSPSDQILKTKYKNKEVFFYLVMEEGILYLQLK